MGNLTDLLLVMSKLVLKGYIVVAEEDLAAVEAALPEHSALTRQEPGCLKFEVKQDPDNQSVFNIYEEFVDNAAFQAHKQRMKNTRWVAVAANVERHYEISEG